jgi:hypothetical protein
MIKYAGDPKRDLEIINICEHCKEKYHPRKGNYLSRFCSSQCTVKGMRGVMQQPFGKKIDQRFKSGK